MIVTLSYYSILIVAGGAVLAILGVMLGTGFLYLLLILTWPMIEQASGLYLVLSWPGEREVAYLAIILAGGLVAGIIPAIRAYKMSLLDGLTIRV